MSARRYDESPRRAFGDWPRRPLGDWPRRPLKLDRNRGWLGGVCAGFARFWRVDPLWVRIAAVTGAFMFPQLAIALYAACWLLIGRA